MATDKTITDPTVADAPQEVTLNEFCIRLSVSDKRVEMIGAFNYSETVAGHMKDTEDAFAARYQTFINKPV